VASNSESLFAESPIQTASRSVDDRIGPTPADLTPRCGPKAQQAHRPSSYNRGDGKAAATSGRLFASLAKTGIAAPDSSRPVGGAAKRMFDLVSAVAAVAALLPLFLIVCGVVYAESPGPVLFRHRRIGFGGEEFVCLKFRTMVIDAEQALREHLAHDEQARREWLTTHKLRHDPRVTWFGRFLRQSSLDELPQLFNVLAGKMSIVGPRPIVAEEVSFYRGHFSDYASARPGLTGLWQISGRNRTSYAQRVAYDVEYLRNWSFKRDMRIIAATGMHVWQGSGAY
jgi:exopolysaccharide production protein ExoY